MCRGHSVTPEGPKPNNPTVPAVGVGSFSTTGSRKDGRRSLERPGDFNTAEVLAGQLGEDGGRDVDGVGRAAHALVEDLGRGRLAAVVDFDGLAANVTAVGRVLLGGQGDDRVGRRAGRAAGPQAGGVEGHVARLGAVRHPLLGGQGRAGGVAGRAEDDEGDLGKRRHGWCLGCWTGWVLVGRRWWCVFK